MTYHVPPNPLDPSVCDPDAVIAAGWPLDGPYSHLHTITASYAAAELVRYLNYATRTAAGLPDPLAVYEVLGTLEVLVSRLPQALDQVAMRLAGLAGQPNAVTDALGAVVTPRQVAEAAYFSLTDAAVRLEGAARSLAAAQTHAGRLSLRESGEAGR